MPIQILLQNFSESNRDVVIWVIYLKKCPCLLWSVQSSKLAESFPISETSSSTVQSFPTQCSFDSGFAMSFTSFPHRPSICCPIQIGTYSSKKRWQMISCLMQKQTATWCMCGINSASTARSRRAVQMWPICDWRPNTVLALSGSWTTNFELFSCCCLTPILNYFNQLCRGSFALWHFSRWTFPPYHKRPFQQRISYC